MADTVLRLIRRRCIAIERAFHQGSAGPREVHSINISIANLRRVEDAISSSKLTKHQCRFDMNKSTLFTLLGGTSHILALFFVTADMVQTESIS